MKKLYLLKQGLIISRKLLFVELARHSKLFFPTIPFHPATAGILLTDNCNSKCITCTQWRQKSSDELSLNEISDLLTELKELGISWITLSGGEPLLRKDLPDIVRRCSTLKFDEIAILTNGLLLTKHLAEQLLESGVTTIGVSLDGLKEINDSIRGVKGSYEKAVSALTILSELRDEKYKSTNLYVATTLMKPTLNQIIPLLNVVRDLKVQMNLNLIDSSPYFFQVDVADLMVDDQSELDMFVDEIHKIKSEKGNIFPISHTHASFEYVRKYFKDPKREDIPCILGHIGLDIGAHGEVYSGCFSMKPLGNIRERSLKEIINSAEYKRRLSDMFYKRCPGCSCGYKTNLIYYAPWVKDEILWNIKIKMRSIARFLSGKYEGE